MPLCGDYIKYGQNLLVLCSLFFSCVCRFLFCFDFELIYGIHNLICTVEANFSVIGNNTVKINLPPDMKNRSRLLFFLLVDAIDSNIATETKRNKMKQTKNYPLISNSKMPTSSEKC